MGQGQGSLQGSGTAPICEIATQNHMPLCTCTVILWNVLPYNGNLTLQESATIYILYVYIQYTSVYTIHINIQYYFTELEYRRMLYIYNIYHLPTPPRAASVRRPSKFAQEAFGHGNQCRFSLGHLRSSSKLLFLCLWAFQCGVMKKIGYNQDLTNVKWGFDRY